MSAREPLGRLCAAIDLGTNTFLMLIGRVDANGELEVVDDSFRTPRLGAGLAATGRIADDARERGLAVLGEFRERLRELGIPPEDARAVGTAALRRASNASEFVALAKERIGIDVEVISEEEEAHLGYSAVIAEGASQRSVVVDVGGGSTEIASNNGRDHVSAPIGAVVLTERWQGDLDGRAWADREWLAMREEIADACRAFPTNAAAGDAGRAIVLGGTGANVACLAAAFERFDPRAVEGRRFAADQVELWAEHVRQLPLAHRLELPLEPERAAILPAGLACLAGALTRIGAHEIRVTGRGLRYGVLRKLATG